MADPIGIGVSLLRFVWGPLVMIGRLICPPAVRFTEWRSQRESLSDQREEYDDWVRARFTNSASWWSWYPSRAVNCTAHVELRLPDDSVVHEVNFYRGLPAPHPPQTTWVLKRGESANIDVVLLNRHERVLSNDKNLQRDVTTPAGVFLTNAESFWSHDHRAPLTPGDYELRVVLTYGGGWGRKAQSESPWAALKAPKQEWIETAKDWFNGGLP